MNTRQRLLLLTLTGLALLLAGCGGLPSAPTATPGPTATITPGGLIVMALPTVPPSTGTPEPTLAPAAPANVLTAAPAMQSAAECPLPGSPQLPDAPASYNLYPTVINQFLSGGGTTGALAALLQAWGAVGDDFGQITDAYDMTGDGVYEVLVVLADPLNPDVSPQPGQLFIFGCHEGGYRLLYSSDYGPGFGMPSLLYVGDMNANGGPEVVYFQQRCQDANCVQAAQVLSWSAPNDGFLTLNIDTVGAVGGQFSLQDLDGDNILEIMIQGGGAATDSSAGPPRGSTTVWDWNGLNYVRALTQQDAPVYRIHVIHDADRALEAGDGESALSLYRAALDNPQLGSWQIANEPEMLRGYALYRLMLTLAYLEDSREALDVYTELMANSAPSMPAYGYSAVGNAFWQSYQATNNLHEGCLAAVEVAASYPQTVLFLNGYGPANRTYQIPDICPF